MNIVNFNTEVRTMSSVEIAELTGKRHDNVLEDVRKMLSELLQEHSAGMILPACRAHYFWI